MSTELIKAGLETSNNILLEIYGDLLKPGVSQVGKAIGTLIGLGNTLLIPIALKNEKSKVIMQDNLNKYRQKLEQIPEENIQAVVPEVGVPILEKLMYVTEDTLVGLYTELLANASNVEKVNTAHPSFINIINNLSPKEAELLIVIEKDIRIIVDVSVAIGTSRKLKPLEQVSDLLFNEDIYDDNFSAYLSNLVGLGLIKINFKNSVSDKSKYENLENEIKLNYSKLPKSLDETSIFEDIKKGNFHFNRGIIEITDFGRLFLVACTDTVNTITLFNACRKM